MIEHCHEEGGYYPLARFSALRLSSLRPHERGFKRQKCQRRGSENCSDEVAKGQSTRFYETRIHALIRRWNIAIERKSDYVEK